MRQIYIMLVIVLFFSNSKADESRAPRILTIADKQRIARALNTLEAYDVIDTDQNNCVQFDRNIIDKLKQENLLNYDGSKLMVICIGQDK